MTEPLTAAAADYALGIADEPIRRAIDAELSRDADLAAEVASYREVVALLALAAQPVAPPAALRERIVGDARAVRPIFRARGEAQAKPSRPSRLFAAVPWLALAASLGGVAVLYGRLSDLRSENSALVARADSVTTRLATSDSLLSTVLAPDARFARLVSSGAPPGATMFFNPRTRQVVLASWQLPPAGAGRTYQLWAIAGGAPVSLGTFNTMPGGELRASFTVPAGVEIATGAITEEPAGGSPQPTSAPFLVGNLVAGGG
jgi:anti-sigma-K factor RskA